MGYRRSSVRKMSYYNPDDPTFFGEDIDPGDGLYGTVWFGFPEDGENAFNIEAVEQGDGTLKCDVMSPEDYDHGNGYIGVDSVDSFTATDWGNMYDVFNQRFIFGPLGSIINNYFSALYDDDDQDEFASVNRASRTRAIASDGQFVFYDEKFNPGNGLYLVAYYGPENDKRDSLVLELEGDAATYFTCTVKAPDGTVIDTFTVDDWESYKSSFYGEMDYGILDFDEYLNDWLDRKYGVSAGPNTASRDSSVKKSYISEFDTWGESVDSYNEDGPFHATIAYGEPYNDDNSVTMEAVGDNGVDGPVNCKVLDISWDNVVDTFQAETWDEAVREFEYRCRQYEYDEYLESDDEEFLRLNGIDASRKRAFRKSHRTAKRKMTMKEKLALINEDKLDEEDDPINPFF